MSVFDEFQVGDVVVVSDAKTFNHYPFVDKKGFVRKVEKKPGLVGVDWDFHRGDSWITVEFKDRSATTKYTALYHGLVLPQSEVFDKAELTITKKALADMEVQ